MKRLLLCLALSGCANGIPVSVTAGFGGATVTVATPGWHSEVPVVKSRVVNQPVLMVPQKERPVEVTKPPRGLKEVTVGSVVGKGPVVPVVSAPVVKPVLVVPY